MQPQGCHSCVESKCIHLASAYWVQAAWLCGNCSLGFNMVVAMSDPESVPVVDTSVSTLGRLESCATLAHLNRLTCSTWSALCPSSDPDTWLPDLSILPVPTCSNSNAFWEKLLASLTARSLHVYSHFLLPRQSPVKCRILKVVHKELTTYYVDQKLGNERLLYMYRCMLRLAQACMGQRVNWC